MATLVLTAAAGAAAGSFGGGVVGALAGSVIKAGAGYVGRTIDNNIFGGGRLPAARGLRLADLSVQTSTYGKMIPIVYGQARIAGNVIWSRPIKETATTSNASVGGKGGATKVSQSQTTYSYSVTLAIAICEGEIDSVLRVWADASVIDITQGIYRLYKGDEAQLPDPYIEGIEGIGKTPAYRGLSYVVIEDFPLANYGNRIPNFTFEVKRRVLVQDESGDVLEEMIKGMVLIPGSGEFVYDTVVQTKVPGELVGSNWVQKGPKVRINQNNTSNKADALVGLDQLLDTCRNLEWVAVVCTWFGTSLDAGDCIIQPGVEYQESATTEPDIWSSATFTRDTAHQITLDGLGNPIYGGTPSDQSILRYLDELKSRGLKIMFYPMFFMDIENKPWRGRVTGTATEVANFFTKTDGYNAFITHYANLVKTKVDAFVIGSELIGLTKVYTGTTTRSYPAVDALVSLAATVKGIVGSGVKVTYAADWSEYHHTDDGWYNMDPLWASTNIDFIGIDAYFPLTNEPQSGYDVQKVIDGWTEGEGYDWYYTDPERTNQASLAAPYAWKNINWWWTNTHTNPNSVQTSWVPQSKKIWFTEYGFPSLDGATNQPNVFYDPNSIESYFPYHSRGRIDFRAQRQGLLATEKKWKSSTMIERMFIWTWDARPFPFWPDLVRVWTDGPLWKYGHWVNGKLGLSSLAAIVRDNCIRAGLTDSDIDVSRLTDLVDGYVIADIIPARGSIETLQAAYFFDAVESDGVIKFVPRGGSIAVSIPENDLIPAQKREAKELLLTSREQEIVLPQRVNVNYINGIVDYQPGNQHSQRLTSSSLESLTMSLPIVMTDQQAKNIADITLFNAWMERTIFSFAFPHKYMALEPTDIIEITTGNITHKIRLVNAQYSSGVIEAEGVAEDITVYDFYSKPGEVTSLIDPVIDPGDTRLDILDLPAFPSDNPQQAYIRLAGTGYEDAWQGAQVSRSDDGGTSYQPITNIDQAAVIGSTITALANGPTAVSDQVNKVTVSLISGSLESVSELALLNGKNLALLGNEIIQFKNATLLSELKYELSYMLRGRLGSEDTTSLHVAGEIFVLLDDRVLRTANAISMIGLLRKYKPVSYGHTLTQTDSQDFIFSGVGLKPYSPVHIIGSRDGSGNLTITWVRRTRISGDLRDFADVPLNEEKELYEIEIMNGSNVVRYIKNILSPQAGYTAADQIIDFGSTQSSISIKVYQVSGVVGKGKAGIAVV